MTKSEAASDENCRISIKKSPLYVSEPQGAGGGVKEQAWVEADQGGKVLSIPVEELMMDFLNKLFSKKERRSG